MIRRLGPALVLSLLLSGCLGTSLPTQQNPNCSWDSTVPANSGTICVAVYRTLNGVARAEETGDRAAIHRLVANARVRGRITKHSRALRTQSVSDLHVVPSFTLDQLHAHIFGAGFYLNGQVRGGRVNSPMTVELRVVRAQAVIVNDQPGQEW